MFVGKNLITLKQVDSTNNYAKLLTANSRPVPDGTVILADTQTGGRGQAGTSWVSEPGMNLTFSVLLGCGFLPPIRQFHLSMAVSLGIVDALGRLMHRIASAGEEGGNTTRLPALAIKWPNDILLGRKKMGGILIENLLAGSRIKNSIVGIGLNINQEDFPGLPGATSLKLGLSGAGLRLPPGDALTGVSGNLHLPAVLDTVCQGIEARFLQLKGGAYDSLKEDYLRYLFGFGRKLHFCRVAARPESGAGLSGHSDGIPGSREDSFEGIIAGITPEGKLRISTSEGMLAFEKKQLKALFGN